MRGGVGLLRNITAMVLVVKSNIETGSLSDCLVLSGDNSCVVM